MLSHAERCVLLGGLLMLAAILIEFARPWVALAIAAYVVFVLCRTVWRR